MPKKKVAPKKKVVAKKMKRSSAPVSSPRPSSSSSVWSTPYLHSEQQEFYKQHPNAKMLLSVFILAAVVFLVLYFVPMMNIKI